jgi:hypothetical protein
LKRGKHSDDDDDDDDQDHHAKRARYDEPVASKRGVKRRNALRSSEDDVPDRVHVKRRRNTLHDPPPTLAEEKLYAKSKARWRERVAEREPESEPVVEDAYLFSEAALKPGAEEEQQQRLDFFGGILHRFSEHVDETVQAQNVYSRAHLTADLHGSTSRCSGDERLDAIRKTLNGLGYTRSHFQKLFHESFVAACLPLIYGDGWELASDRVMRELRISRIRPEVMVQTPRRFGKTVSVAMFVLAMMLHCPGIRICIFSTGKRASSGLMTEIWDLLKKIKGAKDRVTKHNQEQLCIAATAVAKGARRGRHNDNDDDDDNLGGETLFSSHKTVSTLYCFPGGTSSQLLCVCVCVECM